MPGAFLLSGEKRGAVLDYLVVESLAGADLRLANPWPGSIARLRDAGTRQEICRSKDDVLAVPTSPDQVLILDRPDAPYESIAVKSLDGEIGSSVNASRDSSKTVMMGCQGVLLVDHGEPSPPHQNAVA